MEFINLDKKLQNAVEIAKSLASENGNAKYTPAHLLKAMLNKEFDLASNVCQLIQIEESNAENPKDEYGNSLIAIRVSRAGKLLNATLRCKKHKTT